MSQPGSQMTTGPAAPPVPPDSPQEAERLASLPMFSQPRRRPETGPQDPQDQAPAGVLEDGGGLSSNGAPASIPAFFKQRAKSYSKIAATLLRATGGYLNLASQTDSEAFIPDEDDEDTITPPLGRLAARRIKIGADPDQLTDVEDIAQAVVGIGVWLAKGVSVMWEARRERRRLEAGRAVYDEGDKQQ